MTRLPIQIWALTASAFAIGTTEFVIMGLLPEISTDLGVSIKAAGLLVTGYALGVVVGAPILTLATRRAERKASLLGLMGLFIAGNVLAALAPDYRVLMLARIIAAFCHGTFFGVGSVAAASLVPPERRASAIALMFTGLALANILGVPAGTLIGQTLGWRATFWVVSGIGVCAAVAIALLIRPLKAPVPSSIARELAQLWQIRVWLSLLTTAFGFGGVFVILTYIAPILREVTGLSPHAVAIVLLVFGAGLTIGNILGGKFADIALMASTLGILASLAVLQFLFRWIMPDTNLTYGFMLLWGIAAFATIAPLQSRIVATVPHAPALASSLNIAAFNLGNAGGAALGGEMIQRGLPLPDLAFAGALVTGVGLALALISTRLDQRRSQ